MGLFGFRKRMEEETKHGCCCSQTSAEEVKTESGCCGGDKTVNSIKVLGAGCKSCHEQYENAKKAVEQLDLKLEVEYITDMEKIMSYGVMSMPAIVINEKVVSTGKILNSAEIIKLIGKLGFQ